MAKSSAIFLVAAFVFGSATACGGSVEIEDTGAGGEGGNGGEVATGGGTTGVTTTSAGGAGGAPTEGLPEGFCDDTCSAPIADGCFAATDCGAFCNANVDGWTTTLGAAFAKCVNEHALCFETVEDCMLAELHEPGALYTVRVNGSGFGEQEGRTIHVWHDPLSTPDFGGQAVIANGAFSLEWEASILVSGMSGPLMLAYIDVDGDGVCSSAADLTASVYPVWNGDLAAPVFEISLTAPLADPDFVCDYAP